MKTDFNRARNAALLFLSCCDKLDYAMADGIDLAAMADQAKKAEDELRKAVGMGCDCITAAQEAFAARLVQTNEHGAYVFTRQELQAEICRGA